MKDLEKIKEVQRYFIDKIIKGEFEEVHSDVHLWEIKVSDKTFVFWIANGIDYFEQYNEFNQVNFIQLDLTEEERELIYKNNIEGREEEIYIKASRELYEKLKQKFEGKEVRY